MPNIGEIKAARNENGKNPTCKKIPRRLRALNLDSCSEYSFISKDFCQKAVPCRGAIGRFLNRFSSVGERSRPREEIAPISQLGFS